MTVSLNQTDSDEEKQQSATSIITKQAERSTKKKNKMEKIKEKTGEEEETTTGRNRSRSRSRDVPTTIGRTMASSTTTTTEGSDNSGMRAMTTKLLTWSEDSKDLPFATTNGGEASSKLDSSCSQSPSQKQWTSCEKPYLKQRTSPTTTSQRTSNLHPDDHPSISYSGESSASLSERRASTDLEINDYMTSQSSFKEQLELGKERSERSKALDAETAKSQEVTGCGASSLTTCPMQTEKWQSESAISRTHLNSADSRSVETMRLSTRRSALYTELLSEEPIDMEDITPVTQHEMLCVLAMLWEGKEEYRPYLGYEGNWSRISIDGNKEWTSTRQLTHQLWEVEQFNPPDPPTSHIRALSSSEGVVFDQNGITSRSGQRLIFMPGRKGLT